MSDLKYDFANLILSFNRAMWGEIPWSLRRISTKMEEKLIKVQFVFDGAISEDDRESAGEIATGVIADHPEYQIREEYARIDEPQLMPDLTEGWRLVFLRKEPRNPQASR
jgi:hypothetical protein